MVKCWSALEEYKSGVAVLAVVDVSTVAQGSWGIL